MRHFKRHLENKKNGGIKIRLLLELQSANSFAYSVLSSHKMQGFIYNQLLGTPFESLHDKQGCKFFCFSNVFSPNKPREKREFQDAIKEGQKLCWLVSSPSSEFAAILKQKFYDKMNQKELIKIGEALFEIVSVKSLNVKLADSFKLVCATPIVVRIPQYAYAGYGIESGLSFLYWRPDVDFNAFIKQLEENIFKKYGEFHGESLDKFPLFEVFRFKKATVNEIVEENKTIPVHGSIWEFSFSHAAPSQKKILEFAIDCGFGERNSLGFGFVNVIKEKLGGRLLYE